MESPCSYEELVEFARQDEDVVGLVLTGSRGRGAFVGRDSDWDIRLVVRDEARDASRPRYATPHGSTVEVAVLSLSEFEAAGEVETDSAWDRYSYVRATVVLDKLDGRIGELVKEKGVLPAEVARAIAVDELDTYINSYYRSAKNLRDGLVVEAHLDAAESIAPLLTTLFALNGRVRPFNRYLRWELETHPLEGALWSAEALLPWLQVIVSTGSLPEQQRLFRDVEQVAREHGLDHVIDGWEADLTWLRGGPPR